MKIAIGSDHAGFKLKSQVIEYLKKKNIFFKDFGAFSSDPVDYPDIAHPVARAIAAKKFDRGILVCGSGLGMTMAAFQTKGIRAANCLDVWMARMSRAHNDANLLCLGGRRLKKAQALRILQVWLKTKFEGGRHLRRVKKI